MNKTCKLFKMAYLANSYYMIAALCFHCTKWALNAAETTTALTERYRKKSLDIIEQFEKLKKQNNLKDQ